MKRVRDSISVIPLSLSLSLGLIAVLCEELDKQGAGAHWYSVSRCVCDRSSLYSCSGTSQFLFRMHAAPLHLLVSMKSAPDHRSFDCSFCLCYVAVVPNP